MEKNKEKPKAETPELIKYKAALHQMVKTPFGEMGVPVVSNSSEVKTICKHNLPPIPLDVFYAVLCWQREIAKEHSCESHTSLFLIDGKWHAEPFIQHNVKGSMTIDVNYMSDENIELFNDLVGRSENGIHATIHNHVNSPAGQSSVDVADEQGLCGPHITIGNMSAKEISFHARFSIRVNGQHYFIPMRFADIIEMPLPPAPSWDQIELVEKALLTSVPDYGWPKAWTEKFQMMVAQTRQFGGGVHNGYSPYATQGKKTPASGKMGSSAPTPGDTYSPFDIVAEDIDLTKAPWALIRDLKTGNWVDFKADYQGQLTDLSKPMINIMAAHDTDLYAIFTALSKKKDFEANLV